MISLALTWTLFLRRANLAISIICCAISLATFTMELFSSSHLSVSSCNSLAASWNNIGIINKYGAWSVREVCASFSLQPINTIMSSTKLSRGDTSVCFEFLLAHATVWFQKLLSELSAVLTNKRGYRVIFHCTDPFASSARSCKQRRLCRGRNCDNSYCKHIKNGKKKNQKHALFLKDICI